MGTTGISKNFKKIFSQIPALGFSPKIPLKADGIRIDPPMSEPMPITEPAAARSAPSPPLLPPTIRLVSYGLLVRPKMLLVVSHLKDKIYHVGCHSGKSCKI